MKKAKIGLCEVEIYDNIEEMPVTRWHKYQKYSIIDSGIGCDLQSVDAHITRAATFYKRGETDKAITELENLRQNIFFIQNETDLHLLSCACLIKSIDGKPCDDLTDEGLQRVIDTLTDVPRNIITAIFVAVKKKIDADIAAYFPMVSDDSQEKEYADLLRAHTLERLKDIQGKGDKAKIEELYDKLVTKVSPTKFTGQGNFEVDYDKQFERMNLVLSQRLHINPKECTVMEYYNGYEVLKEQTKAQRYGRRK